MHYKNITRENLSTFAKNIAEALTSPLVICLWGDLGVGKSTLSREILLCLDPSLTDLPSPTFTLVQQYDTPKGEVWHCDLYRLTNPGDIVELGLEEAFYEVITLIEWPDKMGDYLPRNRLDIHLSMDPSNPDSLRILHIEPQGTVIFPVEGLTKS